MTELDRISLELTNRCGKACWFCYNASDPQSPTRWDPVEVVDFVTDCARNRIKAVSFGGGEPLEYPELFEVLTALRGLLFRSFTTNGLALDEAMDSVVGSAPDKVHVSIHFPGNDAEVGRVIRQVGALHAAGIVSGINLLVRASQVADAMRCAARIRASGIGNDRIVYLPMRGSDTPTADDLGRVAGGVQFQSMSCLMACTRSPSFVSIGADRHAAWCSYTRSRQPLAHPTHAALVAVLADLGLEYCATPRIARSLPVVPT
ncbi:MAG: radical SAM protein [Kofleriaceae bacterium]|nr:radical SAM protein [Kofleriaceae bacterium]